MGSLNGVGPAWNIANGCNCVVAESHGVGDEAGEGRGSRGNEWNFAQLIELLTAMYNIIN